jgi:Fe2+ or Zn2+ uptake regulation protein
MFIMKTSFDSLANALKKQNIRVSNRRKLVLEYMCRNLNHPTAEQIYMGIKKDMPHLSRTTIYNTLHTLTEAGLVRLLNIEDNETRYDIMTEDHGHFKCEKCGAIFNFRINPGTLAAEDLSGFKVTDRNVYFKGVCPRCLSNNDDNS